jgi:hypothetical protein
MSDADRFAAELNRIFTMLHNHFHSAVGIAVVMKFADGKVGTFADVPREELIAMLRKWMQEERSGKKRITSISDSSRMKN